MSVEILKGVGAAARHLLNKARNTYVWRTCGDGETASERRSCESELCQLADFERDNRDVRYHVTVVHEVGEPDEFDFVGAQVMGDYVVFVPNGSSVFVLVGRDGTVERVPFDKSGNDGSFRWTGGAVFDGKLFCFPRTSDDLLVFDPVARRATSYDLGQDYGREHHYGGVVYGGIAYLPPRDEDHLLRIDLAAHSASRIQLAPKWLGLNARYCGGVLHPNGLIYFLPERGRVIEFDPRSERFRFMGGVVEAMAFGAAVSTEGDIYGFSGYANGILHINPERDLVEMVRTDIGCPGAYGTRLGVNGLIYSVPGGGDSVLEFDPKTGVVESLLLPGGLGLKAKCAGSAMFDDGTMAFAPALGADAYFLVPSRSLTVPPEFRLFFDDGY